MSKDKSAYIRLMVEALEKIYAYTDGMDFAAFSIDGKTQSAVIMQLHVMGELAKSVPDDIRAQIDVPWKNIAGFRDMAAHQYFNLSLPMVWEIVAHQGKAVEDSLRAWIDAHAVDTS